MIIKHSHGIKDVAGLEKFVNNLVPGAAFRVTMTNETESTFQVADNLKKEVIAAVSQFKDGLPGQPEQAQPPSNQIIQPEGEEEQIDNSADAVRAAMKAILGAAQKSSHSALAEATRAKQQFGDSIKSLQDAGTETLRQIGNLEARIVRVEQTAPEITKLRAEFDDLKNRVSKLLNLVAKAFAENKV